MRTHELSLCLASKPPSDIKWYKVQELTRCLQGECTGAFWFICKRRLESSGPTLLLCVYMLLSNFYALVWLLHFLIWSFYVEFLYQAFRWWGLGHTVRQSAVSGWRRMAGHPCSVLRRKTHNRLLLRHWRLDWVVCMKWNTRDLLRKRSFPHGVSPHLGVLKQNWHALDLR